MKHLPVLLALLASALPAHAAFSERDVTAALEAKYGPFSENTLVSVEISRSDGYDGSRTVHEEGLPDGFLAVVWDRKSDRFAALVEEDGGKRMRIAGKVVMTKAMPVPLRRIAPGETISPDDIGTMEISAATADRGFVESAADVIGKEAVRLISPDRPIPEDSVALPSAVSRNQTVVVLFRKGVLELSAKGKSLGDAAVGESVKVSRPESSKVLEGIAVSDGVVRITQTGEVR